MPFAIPLQTELPSASWRPLVKLVAGHKVHWFNYILFIVALLHFVL